MGIISKKAPETMLESHMNNNFNEGMLAHIVSDEYGNFCIDKSFDFDIYTENSGIQIFNR